MEEDGTELGRGQNLEEDNQQAEVLFNKNLHQVGDHLLSQLHMTQCLSSPLSSSLSSPLLLLFADWNDFSMEISIKSVKKLVQLFNRNLHQVSEETCSKGRFAAKEDSTGNLGIP